MSDPSEQFPSGAAGTPSIDEAAVLWSAAGEARAGRPLLILLHGYGSDEADLFGLSPYLPLEPVVASLRAPSPAGAGFAWFRIAPPAEPRDADGLAAAAGAVLAWLDGLDPSPASVGLLGFSQGGALALELLRTAPGRFTFAVTLAGFTTPGERPGDEELARRRPPVFWGRGTRDAVIREADVELTADWLPSRSSLVERIYEDLGHSVSRAELADVAAFLRERYA